MQISLFNIMQVYLWEASDWEVDSEYDGEWSGLLSSWDGPSRD